MAFKSRTTQEKRLAQAQRQKVNSFSTQTCCQRPTSLVLGSEIIFNANCCQRPTSLTPYVCVVLDCSCLASRGACTPKPSQSRRQYDHRGASNKTRGNLWPTPREHSEKKRRQRPTAPSLEPTSSNWEPSTTPSSRHRLVAKRMSRESRQGQRNTNGENKNHLVSVQKLRGHLSPSIKCHVAVLWKGAPKLPVILGQESQHVVMWKGETTWTRWNFPEQP